MVLTLHRVQRITTPNTLAGGGAKGGEEGRGGRDFILKVDIETHDYCVLILVFLQIANGNAKVGTITNY